MKRINLGLQGGGAHGAYTWGVLDRILEDERIEIAAMSGTSAGAMNGAALKSGWVEGGREGAREKLSWLWERMGAVEDMRWPAWMAAGFPASGVSRAMALSVPFAMADTVSRAMSPYAYGPFYRNPLRPIAESFNYDKVCTEDGPALYVSATNVRDGKIRVFPEAEISTDVLLASSCLPNLFQAVEIDGEHYWDGGYTGNPALFPLFEEEFPQDVVIININPLTREDVPRTAHDIQNRINEISFNSSLLRELRAIAFVQRLLREGALSPGRMKNVLVHMIADDALMRDLSVATKLVPVPELMWTLRDAGRAAADGFLAEHFDDLNERGTVDLAAMFN
ncbi:patatin-like phospholipase family protein [Roseovarius sp. SCSIO 43702]|uniref:patatin-like phospholipase family protein n=1 Tax=Roseovarius sp. SCSIO 43702 TaxID=2823043 RepID=UPI001C72CF44|nr:patatin-like phospholipase family protein [Roseovarius sp. SCSIO 43702]QYX58589.1 patatin-like phospholipase family protein [Roseovarius sp. SCSIO 43702]